MPNLPAKPLRRGSVSGCDHYYTRLSVTILRLESRMLRVGDVDPRPRTHHQFEPGGFDFSRLIVRGDQSGANNDFGLKVVGHVREHDVVYKMRP